MGPIYWSAFSWEAFSTLTVGSLTVGAAVLLGLRQVAISRRQAEILKMQVDQKDFELAIATFDRRFETIEEINDAINARQNEISAEDPTSPKWPASTALKAMWRPSRRLHVLFSEDLAELLQKVRHTLSVSARAKAALVQPDRDHPQTVGVYQAAYAEYQRATEAVIEAQEEFNKRAQVEVKLPGRR